VKGQQLLEDVDKEPNATVVTTNPTFLFFMLVSFHVLVLADRCIVGEVFFHWLVARGEKNHKKRNASMEISSSVKGISIRFLYICIINRL
jgi:hypothetical protein